MYWRLEIGDGNAREFSNAFEGSDDLSVSGDLSVNGQANLGYKVVWGGWVETATGVDGMAEVDCGANFKAVGVIPKFGSGGTDCAAVYNNMGYRDYGIKWKLAFRNPCGGHRSAGLNAICLRVK